jgi:hypothetical protein
MQLSPQKLKQHMANWRLHLLVQGIGFVVIPVIMLSEIPNCCAERDRSLSTQTIDRAERIFR